MMRGYPEFSCRVFSLKIFVAFLFLALCVMLTGCKGGNGIISPIMPDGNYESDRGHEYPDDSNHRTISESPSSAHMIMTGPEEYLTSELSVKLITSARPIFSARLTNGDGVITSDNFHARIDHDQISCAYYPGDSTVSFQPNEDLKDGMHQAQLIFVNPSGSTRMLHWSFRIRTALPSINMVMWNLETKWALVIFDDAIEPSVMKDASRWTFNRERNILRGPIGSAGDNMALLPLTNLAIGYYQHREPLTIGFNDTNGIIEYVISRGGGSVRDAQVFCEDCSGIGYIWYIPEHTELEAGVEKYAAAYRFSNPLPCPLEMVWEGWTRIPVAHRDPTDEENFYLSEDDLCEGQPDVGHPGDEYPESFSMIIGPNETHTISFDRLYRHDLTVSVWADCNGLNRPGSSSQFETQIEWKRFQFGDSNSATPQGFDCVNPVFDEPPLVLYGDEAADMLVVWMAGIPFCDEEVGSGDQYCFSMAKGPEEEEELIAGTYNYLLWDLRHHSCDLFIIAKASDPIGTDRHGNLMIQDMVLDMKHESGDIDWGGSGGAVTGAIGIDYKPWGGPHLSATLDDFELITDWPDDNYGEFGLYDGQPNERFVRHDWSAEESAILIYPLTDLLLTTGNEDVTDIRVRITDNNQLPEGGPGGNWRRSGNILDQLCDLSDEEGERYTQTAGCSNKLKVRFINHNSHNSDPNWKVVNYSGDTSNTETSFIYTRDSIGNTYLDLFLHLDTEESKIDPREPIRVRLKSSECDVPELMGPNYVYVDVFPLKEEDYGIIPGGKERLKLLFQTTNDCDCFYHAEIAVSDSQMTSSTGLWGCPTLYVSSSDRQFGTDYEAKMDFALSAPYENFWNQQENPMTFKFGKSRGLGHDTPAPSSKQWYSYDEFLTNGGLETVCVDEIKGKYTLDDPQGKDKPIVAVQSEADVMAIIAHGGVCDDNSASSMSGFKYPIVPGLDSGQSGVHIAFNYSGPTQNYRVCGKISDYGVHFSNWWGHEDDKGNFWKKKVREDPGDKELRWLTMIGCATMSRDDYYDPILNWAQTIQDGYLSSVCGFQEELPQHVVDIRTWDYAVNGKLLSGYGENLEAIYKKADIRVFEPTSPCFRFIGFWWDNNPNSPEYSMTTDISVAAFMEAACNLYGNCTWPNFIDDQENYDTMELDTAIAIDRDNVTGQYYYWTLKSTDVIYYRGLHAYNVKIRRYNLDF